MDLQEKVSHFPTRPGVYLMEDAQGRVLYVGKAKDLRARVRSYFRQGGDERPRVKFLMARVEDIEPVVTDSEKEALILENTLIKRHRPRYNVDLRDDKTYLSLRLDVQNPFPRLTAVRQVKPDGAVYFGPYSSGRSLKETVELLGRLFPLRQCSDRELRVRERPCLYHDTRGCRAPCCGRVGEEEYRRWVDEVLSFLKGRGGKLLAGLQADMAAAAAALRFEEAARLRDRVRAIQHTLERQKAVTHEAVDRDVVGLVREGSEAQFAVLVVRAGNLIDRRGYYFADLQAEDPEVVTQFLQQYYRGDRIVPGEVLVPVPLGDEAEALGAWLAETRGRRVRLVHPRRGEKAALLAMAAENARELLAERRRTKVGYEAALGELQARLHLPGPPRQIECYDVSNVQGAEAVASLVTAVDGFAHQDGYRRFVIRTVPGSDDFAMLYEALTRRLARRGEAGWELPDLILVDGGRGQLGAAQRALDDAGVASVALAGLAKARALPGAGEAVEHSPERVFLPGRVNPVVLPRNSAGLFLLQRVRDEAHRFAVEHHRKRRGRAGLASALDAVPGVGKRRRQALLKHFGSLGKLRDATPAELAAVPGISEALAARILAGLGGKRPGGVADG